MHLLIFITLLILIVYFNTTYESFSGASQDNPFTNLTCLPIDNEELVLKIGTSSENPNNITIHSLLNPNNNYNKVIKTDIVDSNIPCDDVKFSGAYVKSIRDINSKARSLFNKINSSTAVATNSTWRTQECTATDLNNTASWCGKAYQYLQDNKPVLCDTSVGKIPARFCSSIDKLENYKSSNDITLGPIVNKFIQKGKSCKQKCLDGAGAIPQSILIPDDLKDSKNGTPLFTWNGINIVSNKAAPGCTGKRCGAKRDPTIQEQALLANSEWNNKFANCIGSCAN